MPNRIRAVAALGVALGMTLLDGSPLRAADDTHDTRPMVDGKPAPEPMDPWLQHLAQDPDDPLVKKYTQMRKQRLAVEQEIKKIRATHFRGIRKPQIRQEGIDKLKAYTDPAVFSLLLELFEKEGQDVRIAILDHLAEQKSDEGDATIAWSAVFSRDEWQRDQATARLKSRIAETGEVSNRIKSVVAAGLKRDDNATVSSAAALAWELRLLEAIPMLINAQVAAGGAGVGNGDGEGGNDSALADILVGTQQAFVVDLQPVVGDNAVAFDPTLGVVTEGVILRVMDAYVITYRADVHESLNRLASAGWGGKDVAHLGWDQQAWRDWYASEYVPYRRQVEAAQSQAQTPNPAPSN